MKRSEEESVHNSLIHSLLMKKALEYDGHRLRIGKKRNRWKHLYVVCGSNITH